jgi:heat shock protein HslJ
MKTILLFTLTCAMTVLVGCGTPNSHAAEPPKPLVGTQWTLAEMDGKAVAVAEGLRTPTLQLDAAAKRASGVSGINRFFGSYETSGTTLKFGPLAGTKMGGPPAAMAVERDFLKAMASVTSFTIASNRLELKAGDKTVLRFQSQ